MKLIIRDYLANLKERDELDALLPDLLLAMGFRIEKLVFRGTVEHGVDVAASRRENSGKAYLYLFQVKSGDIDSTNWDSGKNSIRASLNNIMDVPWKDLSTPELRDLPRKVVLVHNGDVHDNYRERVSGFFGHMRRRRFNPERWHLGKLTDLVYKHLLTHRLLKKEQQSDFRQSLAFLEVSDYDLRHFKRLVRSLIPKKEKPTGKDRRRAFAEIRLILAITYQYAQREANNLSPALLACEDAILVCWNWLRRQGKTRTRKWLSEFMVVLGLYLLVGSQWLARFDHLLQIEDGLCTGGIEETVEYPLKSFHILGRIAFLSLLARGLRQSKLAEMFIQRLGIAIYQISGSRQPSFDSHGIEIAIGTIALLNEGYYEVAQYWIDQTLQRCAIRVQTQRPLPETYSNVDALVELKATGKRPQTYHDEASTLIYELFELCVLLKLESTYQQLYEIFNQSKVELQVWYPPHDWEDWLFTDGHPPERLDQGIIETKIELPGTLEEFGQEVIARLENYDTVVAKQIDNDLPFLMVMLACLHHRVRVPPYVWRKFLLASAKSSNPIRGKQSKKQSSQADFRAEVKEVEALGAELHIDVTFQNVEKIGFTLAKKAVATSKETSAYMYQRLDEIIDDTGNVVDAGGRVLSADLIVEMLEKTEFDFDERGQLQQIFICHPSMAPSIQKVLADPEARRKIDKVIEKKRREFLMSKGRISGRL